MLTRILLVRHGQTAWNRDGRFRARADLPPNAFGLIQAERVAARIAATWSVAAIYNSALQRATQIAESLAKAASRRALCASQPLEGLIDIDYGEWQELSPAEVSERYKELHHLWMTQPYMVKIPGG
ncbi:MAG: histidine phosphatase family protein [Chloroflexota bacterium]